MQSSDSLTRAISIAPGDVNAVGDPHTFTVTVTQDDGLAIGAVGGDAFNGFGAANNAAVTVTLTGTNCAIPDISSPTDLPPLLVSTISGTTNASGIFNVVFSSATAGLVTGHAATDVTLCASGQ